MVYTIEDFPIETDQPIIDVILPVGVHVLELVVEDSAGLRSAPDTVVITVEREIVPEPVIESINPATGQQGETLEATITGELLAGTTAVIFPEESGIGAEVGETSETSVVVRLTIAEDAMPGTYPFQLQMPQGPVESGEVTFEVTRAPVDIPEILSIDPSTGQPGQTLEKVVITGQFLGGTRAVIFPEESGIRAELTSADDVTVVLSPFMIATSAVPGTYPFRLETELGPVDSGRVTFEVARIPVETPVIRSIDPPTGQPGQTLEKVVITGELLGGTRAVIFPEESGIRAEVVSVDDTTVVLSPLMISDRATPGAYPFRLETERGPVDSGRVTFEVAAALADIPVIRSIRPASGQQGETLEEVVITGERLARATAVTFLRPDPRDPLAPWVPDPEMVAKILGSTMDTVGLSISISSRAEPGGRRFTVATPAGTAQSPRDVGFTVERSGIIPPIRVDEIPGIGPVFTERLAERGITDLTELASTEPASLANVLGVSEARATGFIEEAKRLLGR